LGQLNLSAAAGSGQTDAQESLGFAVGLGSRQIAALGALGVSWSKRMRAPGVTLAGSLFR